MMWHGRVRTELRMPSAAPLILGSAFRRETPALDSFLLQYQRVWSLMHILMFSGSIIQNTTKKKCFEREHSEWKAALKREY